MSAPDPSAPTPELFERTLDAFWETIPPLWHEVRGHIRNLAREKFDITVEQFHILRYIRRGRWSVSELATAKNISRPAISRGVDLLVNKGLIDRQPNLDDRRYVKLVLTPAGATLMDALFRETRAWMRGKLTSCSAAELETVIAGLAVLKKMRS